jgi:MoaA/NifB/PqqE/SkfB family radical SAM enzyme
MKFINIKWDMTYNCNLNCKHCLNIQTREGKKDPNYDKTLGALQKLQDIGIVSHMQFLGGEPTVHSQFPEIVTELSNMGIGIGINTNCIKIGRVERIIEDLYEINVSIEGPTRETHEYIRGLDQFSTFERVLTNLKRFKKLKEENGYTFNLILSCVLTKHNLPVIEDMVDLSIEMGANGLNLLQLVEEGNAALTNELHIEPVEELDAARKVAVRFDDLGLTEEDLKLNMRFTYNKVIDYLRKEYAPGIPFTNHTCGAGVSFAYMNQQCELYPCDRLCPDYPIIESNKKIKRMSLIDTDFEEIWESDIYTEAFEMQYSERTYEKCFPCQECKYLRNGCLPCPAQVKNNLPNPTIIRACQLVEELQ